MRGLEESSEGPSKCNDVAIYTIAGFRSCFAWGEGGEGGAGTKVYNIYIM